jgi:hypothetical protein
VGRGRRAWIREQAHLALKLAGAVRPDQINPTRTAQAHDIEITYGGVTGAAERISTLGGRARIRITDAIVLPGRRSFTIAHAIGHKLCGHRIPGERDVEGWIEYACGRRGSIEEREADVFATEHLTPEPWARPYCTVPSVDLEVVRTISRVFPVSPVMAAMRFVELTHHACAIAYVDRGCVKWFKASRSFPGRIEPRSEAPHGSHARRFFDQGAISDVACHLYARAWLPRSQRVAENAVLIEHAQVVPEPGWGGVLSLLWIPSIVASESSIAA